MDSKELRQKFIEFFESKGHKIVPPASLIPENDPSVLFTTAGMQQFKRYYINPADVPAQNVLTVQPCFRTSDMEEVGDDTHLTMFEMLGNFSFGGYGKKQAIEYAFNFLTNVLEIEKFRIWCSVFAGDEKNPRDDESAKILEEMGLVYKEHPREDNFWGPTGNEGPCGPTVEFYIDDIEIWNLVFNEYNFENDKYEPLKNLGIDTGMGLERLLVVFNHEENIYHTDIFELPHKKLHELLEIEDPKSERIILDHIRASVFAINDDILPSNKDRGYIVRRLIRRAIVKGNQIGIRNAFTHEIAKEIFVTYDNVYQLKKDDILSELKKEEDKFRVTLSQGMQKINALEELDGNNIFNLYQSFGIPYEIVIEEAERNNISIEKNAKEEYENLVKKHQDLSRTASAGMFKGGLAGGGEQETKYHTATHLLLASLREILSQDIIQKGSNITAERLRFDFNYAEKMTDEQIKKVEDLVNEKIAEKLPVEMEEMSIEDAKNCGATGTFGDKYGFKVKVYTMGNFSKEICGGPHVKNTGELGHFKITKEESSSAGVRRIKAILE